MVLFDMEVVFSIPSIQILLFQYSLKFDHKSRLDKPSSQSTVSYDKQ